MDDTNSGAMVDLEFPVILAGPSGAGKTTVRDGLLGGAGANHYVFSVSMTTRGPRSNETDGVDYTFATREQFMALVEAGGMLEYAEVHGELYGTPTSNLARARRAGKHLLLDIDVQGARQVRTIQPDVVSIFLVPPDAGRIGDRLRKRGSENAEQVARRLANARTELGSALEFDYLVVNDVVERAVARVRSIVRAEEVGVQRSRPQFADFIEKMTGELDSL